MLSSVWCLTWHNGDDDDVNVGDDLYSLSAFFCVNSYAFVVMWRMVAKAKVKMMMKTMMSF